MKRQVVRFLSAISLVLCFLIAALWLRGIWTDDEVHLILFGHGCIIGSFPNHLDILMYRNSAPQQWLLNVLPGVKHIHSMPVFWELRVAGDSQKWELALPWWMVSMFLMATPLWYWSSAVGRRRRISLGVCAHCGYDLRATPMRCPECGRVAGNKTQ